MNILTFDVEDWFHILDNRSTKTVNEWKNYEVRIHSNMDRIFSILEKTKCRATFFCLGWIAQTWPEIIREIIKRGFEIGTHSHFHQLVYEQTQKDFSKDLERSIKTLEDVSGQKVKYFRAPGFSIREDTKWAFEILAKNGIEVDCSIFPAPRAHGGFPSYTKPIPSILKFSGIDIKELPINYTTIFGKTVIFSGGGYFRLFPYFFIRRWTQQSDYVMSYLHPRDFDAMQPMVPGLTLPRKFKSYVGLKNAAVKLEKWIMEFSFTDITEFIETTENQWPIIDLN